VGHYGDPVSARRRVLAASAALVVLLGAGCAKQRAAVLPPAAAAASPSAVPPSPSLSAAPPGPGLAVIDYSPAPKGFPADPEPMSTEPLTEGLHPTTKLPVYDAPGGTARAYLAPTLSGVPVTTPIVARREGWVAVLLPSVNRTIGWLAPGGWTPVALTDQVVVHRRTHEVVWSRNGVRQQAWTVTIGTAATPTPLGRTFVLARTKLSGAIYAGVDGLALGAVPDNPNAVATGLKGAHIGFHSWSRNEFGYNRSNGCVRMPKPGMQTLLAELAPGTPIVVVD
jgi:hypothetical protein